MSSKSLSDIALEFPIGMGASKVGIATLETLAGGPPSVDIEAYFPGAKSAISFAVDLEDSNIPGFLDKSDRMSFEKDNLRVNAILSGISMWLARHLDELGHPSKAVISNGELVKGADGNILPEQVPPISHRYMAAASGVGYFGWSGNILTEHNGAMVLLGTVITSAELEPTAPLSEDVNYCDSCRLCLASCPADLMERKEMENVNLGGVNFPYSKKRPALRCSPYCTARTGMHKSGKWSTWSPGRDVVPKTDDISELSSFFMASFERGKAWPEEPGGGGFYIANPVRDKKIFTGCSTCQAVCHPDPDERKRRYKLLTTSGVVVQNPDGSLEAVPPEEADRRLAAMSPEVRALYEAPTEPIKMLD